MATINYKAVAILAVASIGYLLFQANQPEDEAGKRITQSAPDKQKAFIDILISAQEKSKQVNNDMQLGGVKAKRNAELCKLMADKDVNGWIGKVTQVSSNSDGKGVFGIQVANDVTIMTSNNAFSDIGYHTLIDPSSQLFSDASALKKGDIVSFSGSFISDKTECLKEVSLSLDGSVKEPDFIFRFSDVAKI